MDIYEPHGVPKNEETATIIALLCDDKIGMLDIHEIGDALVEVCDIGNDENDIRIPQAYVLVRQTCECLIKSTHVGLRCLRHYRMITNQYERDFEKFKAEYKGLRTGRGTITEDTFMELLQTTLERDDEKRCFIENFNGQGQLARATKNVWFALEYLFVDTNKRKSEATRMSEIEKIAIITAIFGCIGKEYRTSVHTDILVGNISNMLDLLEESNSQGNTKKNLKLTGKVYNSLKFGNAASARKEAPLAA